MSITKDQAQMLATLAAACRPNGARRWDTAGVMAALANIRDRSLAEVIMATIRAACDANAQTPGVIPSAGDHWREQLKPPPFKPESAPPGTRCTVCGRTLAEHFQADHAYSRPTEHDPVAWADHVAKLRGKVAHPSGPTEPLTPEDFAAKNPKLHARIEALRANNAGLEAPPMREQGGE